MKPGDRIHWRGREGVLLSVSDCGRFGRVSFVRCGQPDGRRGVMMAECELTADRELRMARERNARTERRQAERAAWLEARYAEVRAAVKECDGESYRTYLAMGFTPRTCCKWLRAAGCAYCKTETGWRWVIKKS
jgi:hypothetical protein